MPCGKGAKRSKQKKVIEKCRGKRGQEGKSKKGRNMYPQGGRVDLLRGAKTYEQLPGKKNGENEPK